MKVPVIMVDRIGPGDLIRTRTALRRDGDFSVYEIEGSLIIISGELEKVRAIAFVSCILTPRARRIYVDGSEINEAGDEPGQFKERHDETGEFVFQRKYSRE